MKKYFTSVLSIFILLSGCIAAPPTDTTSPTATSTVTPWVTLTSSPMPPEVTASPTGTPAFVSPPFISAPLPDGLLVLYRLKDQLWLWQENHAQVLLQREHIFEPQLSDDGQWVTFQQEYISSDGYTFTWETWAMRTDGSELHRLLSAEDVNALVGDGSSHRIWNIAWMPGRHELLFNTEKLVDGPPGSWPDFNLYSLDLSGQATQLAKTPLGGRFFVSPDAAYVAVASDKRIGIIHLESGKQRTLLEFQPLQIGCECLSIPRVFWDPESQFVLTSIPPAKLYYQTEYAGEPDMIWRLHVNGRAELIAKLKASPHADGILVAPDARHYLHLEGSCPDALTNLTLHSLTSNEKASLFCVWNLPQWTPDSQHILYNWDLVWRLGNIADTTGSDRPLDFLNLSTDPENPIAPGITWMNAEYFLLVLHSKHVCSLNVATLEGVIAEIVRTESDVCPNVDFSVSR